MSFDKKRSVILFGGAMLESIILRKYLKVSISPKVLNINQNKKFSNVDFANFHDIQTTDTAVLCKIRNSAKKLGDNFLVKTL